MPGGVEGEKAGPGSLPFRAGAMPEAKERVVLIQLGIQRGR